MATYKLTKRGYDRGAINTFYKTDIPVQGDKLAEIRQIVISELRDPLGLSGNGIIALLVDMSDMTYIVQIIESVKMPYIHQLAPEISA